MFHPAARLVTGVLVAVIGVYGSYTLIAYSDRDDAPGGMVIGAALMVGSVLLGVLIGRPRVADTGACKDERRSG